MSQHSTTNKVAAKPVTPGRSWNRKRVGLTAAFAAVVLGGGVTAMGMASASTTPASVRRVANPADVRRGVTPVVAHPVIVSNENLDGDDTENIQIAGRTFGGTSVPSNATGVSVSIVVNNAADNGRMTVYPTGSDRPRTATLSYRRHTDTSGNADVALGSRGRITVYSSEHIHFTMRLLSFTTPDTSTTPPPPSCTSTISTIAPSTKTLTNVGGSIRSGATDFGSVTLPAGTYDARVIGGFTGAKNTDTWYPNTLFLTGTMVLVKGGTIASDFSNVAATEGGVLIPKSQSATLTQDPTLPISTFLTLGESTEVHVKLFAYASDSGTAGSGNLQGNLQSAQFRKLC